MVTATARGGSVFLAESRAGQAFAVVLTLSLGACDDAHVCVCFQSTTLSNEGGTVLVVSSDGSGAVHASGCGCRHPAHTKEREIGAARGVELGERDGNAAGAETGYEQGLLSSADQDGGASLDCSSPPAATQPAAPIVLSREAESELAPALSPYRRDAFISAYVERYRSAYAMAFTTWHERGCVEGRTEPPAAAGLTPPASRRRRRGRGRCTGRRASGGSGRR